MLRVYNCIVQEHDLRLVVLAAIVCLLASFTAINLVHHVRRSAGHMRKIWLGVAATASGFGIWATHFIAMLAFAPGIPSGYNVTLTLLSLIAAIVLTGIGLGVALSRTLPGARMARRRDSRRRHRHHALYRHGGLRGAGADRLGSRSGHRVDRRRRADRRRGDQGRPDRRRAKVEDLRRAAAHHRHLQPPFHRDGRGLDHPRPQDHRSRNGPSDRLARGRGGAGEPGDPASRLLRPCPRHTRPPAAGAGNRPHARPRQRRRRRPAGLRRRDDRHRQPELCQPGRRRRGKRRRRPSVVVPARRIDADRSCLAVPAS